MKRNLKEQILTLRKEGKTVLEIRNILQCSCSTIAYHLYEKTRIATKRRIKPEYKRQYSKTPRAILQNKYTQFFRLGKYSKIMSDKTFTLEELSTFVKANPSCYLTGTKIDLSDSSSFSLDHKIPISRGGDNKLLNLGLCVSSVNRAKTDFMEEEFILMCKSVLIHKGYEIVEPKNN